MFAAYEPQHLKMVGVYGDGSQEARYKNKPKETWNTFSYLKRAWEFPTGVATGHYHVKAISRFCSTGIKSTNGKCQQLIILTRILLSVQNVSICNTHDTFSACPNGYIIMEGDVSGPGLTGGYAATLKECRNDCDARSDCNSFAHSLSIEQCKLMKEKKPTQSKYHDYQFCQKDVSGTCYLNAMEIR